MEHKKPYKIYYANNICSLAFVVYIILIEKINYNQKFKCIGIKRRVFAECQKLSPSTLGAVRNILVRSQLNPDWKARRLAYESNIYAWLPNRTRFSTTLSCYQSSSLHDSCRPFALTTPNTFP